MPDADETTSPFHATLVSMYEKGVLIIGASGSGKSSLALELMAIGATLVADDRVILTLENGRLIGKSPAAIKGQIEARGLGILAADTISSAIVDVCIDMDKVEKNRLPEQQVMDLFGLKIPTIHGRGNKHLAAGVLQMFKAKRVN